MTTPAKKRVAKKAPPKTARKPRASSVDAETTASSASAAAPAEAPKPKNLLTAGIKALTTAHEEAVARQSRVFESLLGLGKGLVPARDDGPKAATTLDPFGFNKFEDVFDQRVARAIERLAIPSKDTVERLEAEIATLRDEVTRLRTQIAKR